MSETLNGTERINKQNANINERYCALILEGEIMQQGSCLKLGSCGSPWSVNTIFLPEPPEITFYLLICYWRDQRDVRVYNSGCNFIRRREVPCSARELLNNYIFCTPATPNNSKLTPVRHRDIWTSTNFSEWPKVLIYNLLQTQINCSFTISCPAWEQCSQHAHHNAFNEYANA